MTKDEINQIIECEINAIKNLPITENFEKAIDLIYEQIHLKGGKLIVCGIGKAGQIAEKIAATFSSTGTSAVFLHPSETQHGDLGVLQKNDLLLVISNSGKTQEILKFIRSIQKLFSHKLYPQIKIIAIPSNENSLSKKSDICLSTGNPAEICPLGLTPTTSITVMNVISDILVVGVMRKINYSLPEYYILHNGGEVGNKIKKRLIDSYDI